MCRGDSSGDKKKSGNAAFLFWFIVILIASLRSQ